MRGPFRGAEAPAPVQEGREDMGRGARGSKERFQRYGSVVVQIVLKPRTEFGAVEDVLGESLHTNGNWEPCFPREEEEGRDEGVVSLERGWGGCV